MKIQLVENLVLEGLFSLLQVKTVVEQSQNETNLERCDKKQNYIQFLEIDNFSLSMPRIAASSFFLIMLLFLC